MTIFFLSDGAANNTGPWSGAQRVIQEKLGRPLSIFNCILHTAERPLRNLQEVLDGATNGPITTNGPIGKAQKALDDVQGPFVKFVAIPHNLPDVDRDHLKKHADLLPLHDLIVGVANPDDLLPYLETKKAVPMNNARQDLIFHLDEI